MTKHIQIIGSPRQGTSYYALALRCYHSPESFKARMIMHNGTRRVLTNEPFRNDTGIDNHTFILEKLKKIKNLNTSVIKNHAWHINNLLEYDLLDEFKNLNTYNIILIRKNIFESALSQTVAVIKNEWTDHKNFNKIDVPVDMFKDSIDSQIYSVCLIAQNNWNFTYNEIKYFEDLTFVPSIDFFNTNICQVKNISDLRQVKIPDNLFKSPNKKDIVNNYNELQDIALEYTSSFDQEFLNIENNKITDIKFTKR